MNKVTYNFITWCPVEFGAVAVVGWVCHICKKYYDYDDSDAAWLALTNHLGTAPHGYAAI